MRQVFLAVLAIAPLSPDCLSAETSESLTIEQIAMPFEVQEVRMELRWALTRRTYNARELLLTVHQGASDSGSYGLFNLFRVAWTPPAPIQYERTLRLQTQSVGVSHFLEPQLVWAVDDEGDRRQVLVVTELVHGSAGIRHFSLYEVIADGETVPLEFQLASRALSGELADDETLCGSGGHDFGSFPFRFTYAINVAGDYPCRAQRGTIVGKYKLTGSRITLDSAARQ